MYFMLRLFTFGKNYNAQSKSSTKANKVIDTD